MDYRLAVLFAVIVPLVLLVWAFAQKVDAIQRLLIIYWRVASLLGITVYLMIAAVPLSFISAVAARILIPVSLWFWLDLNEEIEDMPSSPLKLLTTSWRWAISVYMGLGALVQLSSFNCAFTDKLALLQNPSCRIWLDPPWGYKQMFHPNSTEGFLGFLGLAALLFYVACFSWFVLVRLKRQGRSATGH
ncbi:MAG TPA: DUF3177 family protein [Oscillatoriaceae cyanobacterium M33_DOE_052]|uniref:DUF3177 family protein n=1 Tax=Planktothricoides sp. SpSt-374 TaxID=2282167 RepID=A0A7C3ZT31_9CYAN|nr:DUF3177 family protein [Oscillatoriaceae cyanobacterium M33_DOE_052]